jgi:hypothetical protein
MRLMPFRLEFSDLLHFVITIMSAAFAAAMTDPHNAPLI